ncbi:fumarylacetoacetase-like, partial [Musca vetustissima]
MAVSFVHIPAGSDFPLENLPYGVFSTKSNPRKRLGVAIGDSVLDLNGVASFYPPEVQDALQAETLNKLMSLGYTAWQVVRAKTQELLLKNSVLEQNAALVQ